MVHPIIPATAGLSLAALAVNIPAALVAAILATRVAGILTVLVLLRRGVEEPIVKHEGATIDWVPADDLGGLAGAAQAATETPADLRRDGSPHHLRIHLAAVHCMVNALDFTDAEAEAAHHQDHTAPATMHDHNINDLSWMPSAEQQTRAATDEQHVVPGGWRGLIEPEQQDLAAEVIEAHVAAVHPGKPCKDVDGRCVALNGPDLVAVVRAAAVPAVSVRPTPSPKPTPRAWGKHARLDDGTTTVDIVPQSYLMPAEIANPALAAFVHGEGR